MGQRPKSKMQSYKSLGSNTRENLRFSSDFLDTTPKGPQKKELVI
jgi:hypothetical protein